MTCPSQQQHAHTEKSSITFFSNEEYDGRIEILVNDQFKVIIHKRWPTIFYKPKRDRCHALMKFGMPIS